MRSIIKIRIITLTVFLYAIPAFSSEPNPESIKKLVIKTEEISQVLKDRIKEKSQDILILADMLKTYSQGGLSVWNKNIVNFSGQMAEYTTIRLINQKGKEVIKVINGSTDNDLLDESSKDYFKTTIKSKVGQIYLSPVLISDISQKPIIKLATPVINLADINKGVLEFDWDMNEIINLLNKTKVGASGSLYLISIDGLFLSHPDKNKIMKENISTLSTAGIENIIKKIKNNENGWGEFVSGNQQFLIAYTPFHEMGWAIAAIIPSQDIDQLNRTESSQMEAIQQSTQTSSGIVSVSSAEDTKEDITPTTRKLLDGSLRAKTIESYRATLVFSIKIGSSNLYTFKTNFMSKELAKSDYVTFLEQNRSRIIGLNDLDEKVYRKTKFELISPSFLQKTKIINQNLVMFFHPLKNEAIRMNRNQLIEYESIFNEKEKRYLKLFTSLFLNQFTRDKFDIKIDDQGTMYIIEMKFKKPISIENETIKKIKLWVQGDYFLPVKYEWLNDKDEAIASIIYSNLEINIPIEDNEFVFNPPQDITVKEYQDIRTSLLEQNRPQEQKTEIKKEETILFTQTEVKNIIVEDASSSAKTIAEILTLASLDFIETADYHKLLNFIDIALKNKNIMYIMILTENGERVIFKSQVEFDGLNNSENFKINEISHPILINNRVIGSVRIGLSLNNLEKLLKVNR
ncbi:hypothetical protein HZA55_05380 [Candidatus Poribacteria bacterium]|nr:hypothetical protein [Candidatus Poribacteria bacterium]